MPAALLEKARPSEQPPHPRASSSSALKRGCVPDPSCEPFSLSISGCFSFSSSCTTCLVGATLQAVLQFVFRHGAQNCRAQFSTAARRLSERLPVRFRAGVRLYWRATCRVRVVGSAVDNGHVLLRRSHCEHLHRWPSAGGRRGFRGKATTMARIVVM